MRLLGLSGRRGLSLRNGRLQQHRLRWEDGAWAQTFSRCRIGLHPGNGAPIRPFATAAPEEPPQEEDSKSVGFLDRVVGKLNDSIKKYPGETIAVLFASDIGSIGAMYGALSISGIEFSPEFALAFAASRPFRRFRLPLDLAVSAAVAKVFPVFSHVRLSDLAGALPNRPGTSVPSTTSSLASKTMAKAKEVVDNYGAAYMMGSRLAGVSVVCGLYLLIKQGVDVMPLLASLGVEEVGTALGSYAAAVVFSSAFYPVTLGVSGYIKRNAPDRSPQRSQRPEGSSCSCVARRRSNGICDLDVWQGTTIDAEAAQSSERLLRIDLPVVKCKQWSIFGFPEKAVLLRLEAGNGAIYFVEVRSLAYCCLLEAELVHDIDVSSPFFGQSSEEITRSDFLLVFIASGLDENLHDMVHKKRQYDHEAMQWGANFLPMLQWDASHKFVTLDLANISLVVPSPINGGDSYPIDVGTISTPPEEEHVGIPTMSFRTHEGFESERGESFKQREQISGEAQATLRHRLTNGSVVETDDYDEETRVTRVNESWESEGTISGSDKARRDLALPRRIPFDQRGRGNMSLYQRPSYRHHSHDLNGGHDARPMSLLQRTVRIRNHPRSLLSNGVYYGALGASWPCLLSSLLAVYVAVIAVIALVISVSVEDPLEQNTDVGFTGKYELVFFFCAQTISTVGYGSLSPKLESDVVNFFVFFLVLAGITLATLLTGSYAQR
ncbi:hypothetical protein BBJ28_00001221 [Nothophytophthora sp. Chile5]|nr:hypothetical protein BBJ28_00001221 [Nothophytophthora sp. Chile5]